MSAWRTHLLQCDGRGCRKEYEHRVRPPPLGIGVQRELAREDGWTHDIPVLWRVGASPSLDHCPGCTGNGEREATIARAYHAAGVQPPVAGEEEEEEDQ